MILRIPPGLSPDLQKLFRDINTQIERILGSKNVDFHGRRIMNAGNAVYPSDYTTLADVSKLVERRFAEQAKKEQKALAARGRSSTGAGGDSGGGGGDYPGGPPTVPLYDGESIVEAYATANPTQLANSCLDLGGNWDFMDGVVAALRAADDRFGYNGKRGDTSDPSEDAVSYYYGDYGVMTFGSRQVYVIDIIAGHCGVSPGPAWQDVTGSGGAQGAWMPTR